MSETSMLPPSPAPGAPRAVSPSAVWDAPRPTLRCRAPVTAATLFEDRAEIERVFTLEVPAGASAVVLEDLTPLLDDARLTARVLAGAVAVEGLRLDRRLVADDRPDGARVAAQTAAAEAAARVTAVAERTLARADERRHQALELLGTWLRTAGRAPWAVPNPGGPSLPGPGDDAEALAARLEAQLAALEAEVARSEAAWAQAQAAWYQAFDAEQAQIQALDLAQRTPASQGGSPTPKGGSPDALQGGSPTPKGGSPDPKRGSPDAFGPRVAGLRCTADLTLTLRAEGAGSVTLAVAGVAPCALWRPAHEACLEPDGTVRFTTGATVWQRTGEAWTGVQLTLSTDRPDRPARLPALTEDALRAQPRADRKRVVLAHRDEAIATDRGEAAVPGVDDGGEARVLRVVGRVDLDGDGRPRPVHTGGFSAPAQVRNLARPEQVPQVFLVARLANAGVEPLLAGPVVMSRGGAYVGLGAVGFVAPGERFELSFGADDRVRVRWRRERVVEHRRLLSDRTHFVQHVDLRYAGDEPLALEVALRLPVSEVEALHVHSSKTWCTEGEPRPDADGIVTAAITLKDGDNRRISLGFHFETDGAVSLPDPW